MNARTLCLNMIVRNEMPNLERFLRSVANHIDSWVIGDTGSTDGTPDFMRAFFAKRGLPGELHSFAYVDFEQARNAALDRALQSVLPFDYLLFADANMELMVEDSDFRGRLEEPCYDLRQRGAGSCWSTRITRRDADVRFRGVAHGYLEAPGDGRRLNGVWFREHADEPDRADELRRDLKLLVEGITREPENRRYWFYLARSLKAVGHDAEAAKIFAKRADMGGCDEEVWYARLQQARCLLALRDEAGFCRAAMTAFDQRPHRAEPLYDLARFYRERGMNEASVLFAEAGLALERPDNDDGLIEDFVYETGLHEEYSIAAYYSRDPVRKERGHAACERVALSREAPWSSRDLARSNLSFYTGSARQLMSSFSAREVDFEPPPGWTAINPSVVRHGKQIVMIQRCVNYALTEAGEYKTADGSPIATRNFLLRLSADLEVESAEEILPPIDLPAPAFAFVLGFEEARPFVWRDELWCCATVRQLTAEGWCEAVLARIDSPPVEQARLVDWRVLRPGGPRRHQMNWVPFVIDDAPRFMCACDPVRVVDDRARTASETTPSIAAESFRGASQAIEFDDGWLALIYEVTERDGRRHHWHRWIWFDATLMPRRTSRRFMFQNPGIETASGLAWHPDDERLVVSFGVAEREAWLSTVDAADVRASLSPAIDVISRVTDESVPRPVLIASAPDQRRRFADGLGLDTAMYEPST